MGGCTLLTVIICLSVLMHYLKMSCWYFTSTNTRVTAFYIQQQFLLVVAMKFFYIQTEAFVMTTSERLSLISQSERTISLAGGLVAFVELLYRMLLCDLIFNCLPLGFQKPVLIEVKECVTWTTGNTICRENFKGIKGISFPSLPSN